MKAKFCIIFFGLFCCTQGKSLLGYLGIGVDLDSLSDNSDPYPNPSEKRNSNVCPAIYCPMDSYIPRPCRRPNYDVGLDGVTQCRLCDSSSCGYQHLCPPRPPCPKDSLIPDGCRIPRYFMAIDGRTRCQLCDESSCGYIQQK